MVKSYLWTKRVEKGNCRGELCSFWSVLPPHFSTQHWLSPPATSNATRTPLWVKVVPCSCGVWRRATKEENLQSCIFPPGPAPVEGQCEVWGQGHNSPHTMWSITHGLEVVREQSREQGMEARMRDTNAHFFLFQLSLKREREKEKDE